MMERLKWESLGKIFDPSTHSLPLGCTGFTQSPQAIELDQYARVYFCTRIKDSDSEKFKSHVAYVDFKKDLSEIIGTSSHEVVQLGSLGAFDEHGIFPFSVFKKDKRITAYTTGWSRRKSVSVETATGFCESFDGGETFKKLGSGPIFSASLHEPFLVGDSFVRYFRGQYFMWYMFGTQWIEQSDTAPAERVYKIGQAWSDDGLNWNRDSGIQIVPDRLHDMESMALPSVEFFDGCYHMFFCYRESLDFRSNPDRSYRLGYARSKDLKKWIRDDEAGGLQDCFSDWDGDMQCYPNLCKIGKEVYLLYNGNEFGKHGFGALKLVSEDG